MKEMIIKHMKDPWIWFSLLVGVIVGHYVTSPYFHETSVSLVFVEDENTDHYEAVGNTEVAAWEPVFGAEHLWEVADDAPDTTLYQRTLWELKRREGYRDTVYTCPAGYLTIGWGLRVDFVDTDSLPDKHAQQLALRTRFLRDFEYVQHRYRGYSRNQYLAMALLRFNVGTFGENLDAALLAHQEFEAIAWWQKYVIYRKYDPKLQKKVRTRSPNLVKAREFEIALFTGRYGQ